MFNIKNMSEVFRKWNPDWKTDKEVVGYWDENWPFISYHFTEQYDKELLNLWIDWYGLKKSLSEEENIALLNYLSEQTWEKVISFLSMDTDDRIINVEIEQKAKKYSKPVLENKESSIKKVEIILSSKDKNNTISDNVPVDYYFEFSESDFNEISNLNWKGNDKNNLMYNKISELTGIENLLINCIFRTNKKNTFVLRILGTINTEKHQNITIVSNQLINSF